MTISKITTERLKELVSYNSISGLMTWITSTGSVKPGKVITCTDSHGYIMARLDRKLYRVHQLAWLYVYGYFPTLIDHINRDKSDNRLINLRECTQRQNNLNASIHSQNKTGYKGVSFD